MNLKREEFHIRTESVMGSKKMLNIFVHDANQNHFSDIQIMFGESFIGYHVGYCTPNEFLRFDKDPPLTASKTWRIFQEEGGLKIWCNDELVLNYKFSDSDRDDCKERFSDGVARVKFKEDPGVLTTIWEYPDDASDYYIVQTPGEKLISDHNI